MSTLLEIFKTMEYGPAPESPDAVKAWLDEHGRKFGLFINNEWVTPKGAKYYSSYQSVEWGVVGGDGAGWDKRKSMRRWLRRVRRSELGARLQVLSVRGICMRLHATFRSIAFAGGARKHGQRQADP